MVVVRWSIYIYWALPRLWRSTTVRDAVTRVFRRRGTCCPYSRAVCKVCVCVRQKIEEKVTVFARRPNAYDGDRCELAGDRQNFLPRPIHRARGQP